MERGSESGPVSQRREAGVLYSSSREGQMTKKWKERQWCTDRYLFICNNGSDRKLPGQCVRWWQREETEPQSSWRNGECGVKYMGVVSVWDGCGYLFGSVEQGGSLHLARLLHHLVETALGVLQQHVGLVVLVDPSGIQNLQSCPGHSAHEQGVDPSRHVLNLSQTAP